MTERKFHKNLNVQFRSQDNLERCGIIRVTIETQTTTTPVQRKNLALRITDDSNPLFLYNLLLSEDDYQHLKREQDLLIDFTAFPEYLVEYLQNPKYVLEFCLNENCGLSSQKEAGTLRIIETGRFKHLHHLVLKLALANDSELKKHLALCLNTTRENLKVECRTTKSLTTELEKTKKLLEDQNLKFEKLKSDSGVEVDRLLALHRHELNAEKEKNFHKQKEMQHQYDKEKNDIQSRLQSLIDQKVTDVDNLKALKSNIEHDNRELKTNINALNKELECLTKLKTQAKDEALHWKNKSKTHDKACQKLQEENTLLKQKVQDQHERLSLLSASLKSTKKDKAECEQLNVSLRKKIEAAESSIKDFEKDQQEANTMIKRFQSQLRNYMQKHVISKEVTERQEKVIESRNRALEEVQNQLSSANQLLKEKEDVLFKTKEELDVNTEKLKKSHEMIKHNGNLIDYLNRQINEVKVTKPLSSANPNLPHQQNPTSNRQIEKNPIQAYSTPITSYIPSSHTIGVSTINTSPNSHNSRRSTVVREDLTEQTSKTADSLQSPLRSSTKKKENRSPDLFQIHPEYFVKSTVEDTVAEVKKPVPVMPGAIRLTNFHRSSNEALSAAANLAPKKTNVLSAYFDGKFQI